MIHENIITETPSPGSLLSPYSIFKLPIILCAHAGSGDSVSCYIRSRSPDFPSAPSMRTYQSSSSHNGLTQLITVALLPLSN